MLAIQSPQGVDPRKANTLFIQEMARRGIHCSLSFKATLAHTEEDIRVTAAAATEALKVVKDAIDHDRFGQLAYAGAGMSFPEMPLRGQNTCSIIRTPVL